MKGTLPSRLCFKGGVMANFDRQQFRLLQILWGSFLFSTFVWGGLAWALTSGRPGQTGIRMLSFSKPLFIVLSLVAICLFILAAQIGRFFPIRSAEDEVRKGLHRFQIPLIRYALFEAVGLVGLIGALVELRFETCLPFLLLAIAGLLMVRPRSRSVS